MNEQSCIGQAETTVAHRHTHICVMINQVLYNAIAEGNVNVLIQQISCQLDEDQRTPNNNTILHVAAQFGKTQCVEEILRVRGKELDDDHESGIGNTKEMLRMTNVEGDTALHVAVRNNHLGVVEILIKEDPEFVHPPNNVKETPLFLAAERGNSKIMSKIMENCKSPHYSGPNGRTALHAAIMCGTKSECIRNLLHWNQSLIEKGDVHGWRPLHYAAWSGHLYGAVQLLILDKSVAYLAAEEDGNKTALHIAASRGNKGIMERLLSYCPDCWEMLNSKGQNILHIAVEHEKNEIIEFILKNSMLSSLINQKDLDGNTPIHLHAAKPSNRDYAPLLNRIVDEGKYFTDPFEVLPGDKDSTSKMAWLELFRNPHFSLINQKDLDGNTPIHRKGEDFTDPFEVLPGDKDSTSKVRMMGCRNKFNSRKEKKWKLFLTKLGRSSENNLLVATLTATVSFAAGFTVPGGYDGNDGPNQGMAVLTRLAAFKAFVLTDAIALIFAVSAVWVHIFAYFYEDDDDRIIRHGCALVIILYAMVAMVIAFITGIYAMLPNSSGLAISVVVICSLFCVSNISYGLYTGPNLVPKILRS